MQDQNLNDIPAVVISVRFVLPPEEEDTDEVWTSLTALTGCFVETAHVISAVKIVQFIIKPEEIGNTTL